MSMMSMRDTCLRDEKDISKIFAVVRARLQAKERELLELQRKDRCLLVPDSDQIDILLDAIAALELSTEDGSFVFALDSIDDPPRSLTSVCSTDFHAIKSLPSTIWLAQSSIGQQEPRSRVSMFHHILSLPIKAYLPSPLQTRNKTPHSRIPLANHLLFMPIDAFKPSSTTCTYHQSKNSQNEEAHLLPTTNSLLKNEGIFAKEYWLQNSTHLGTTSCCT